MKYIGWLFCVLFSSSAFAAGEVEIPLLADNGHLKTAISRVLEFDANGQSTLRNDDCNRFELSDMVVVTKGEKLALDMALKATTGAYVLGACRGPKPWNGRLALNLTPRVAASGLAIEFVPDSIELSRPDSRPGLLSKPVQVIANALVIPRINRLQIDLAGPLNGLDGLIAQLLSPDHVQGGEQSLLQRTHIERLQMEESGLKAWLAFQVRAIEPVELPPEDSLTEEELAQWQTLEDELDGFLTTVISALARSTHSHSLRMELLAVLLDARQAIAEALTIDDPEADPVRELFLSTWDRLRPLMSELESLDTPGMESDFRLAGFIAGGDALKALDALGPEYGFEITRDGLRRLARLLLADAAPPSFTPLPLEVDPEFQELFGFDTSAIDGEFSTSALTQHIVDGFSSVGSWFMPTAHAASVRPADALKGMVPNRDNLDEYLDLVSQLLAEQSKTWLSENNKLPKRLKKRLDPLVRATAWKESCWRQLSGSTSNPQVLRSSVGAVGMMQINGRVWRKVYDLDRLVEEVDYNVNAGIDILTHYLVDYAIRRGEHEQPGGDDNLIKATYAAYNGGPGQLSRYRRDETPGRLKSIDNAFWGYYSSFKDKKFPDISSCYVVGN
ncbi:lytic transglycosylase domain-containing protein [Methylophaga sp. OBS3]|uniref:lytic transglycosylase domain-containing protein n=1 Tax=Methylophaga sp. OBS3 TaxID=2991934 RepID=UPI002259320A|nr:lytic transglycosylase domain-containing protein [Methylophaga sp. OBS3]MCX4190856.1 lytic transglycosylase domain-containing protein [Methylophaga sp. OBS3]